MSEAPINLNRVRKDRARTDARARADANAARHGLTKAEKVLAAARNERAARILDRHQIEDEE